MPSRATIKRMVNSGSYDTFSVDTVSEKTSANGVAIDSVTIKDGTVDVNGTADAVILDADADSTLSAPTDDQVDLEVGGADIITVTNPSAGEHARVTVNSPAFLNTKAMRVWDDEFDRKAFDETNEQWILNSGSDGAAAEPAIVVAEYGTAFLDAGTGDGSIAEDGSQLVWALPVQADSGGLFLEARVKIEDITGCSVNVGFTDVTTLEEPFSIATSTITSVASNAVAFVFDDGATTKEWFMCGVDGDTDATGNGTTETAPVNDTWQTLRIEIDADGEGAEFFINDTSVGSLTASVVGASTNLYPTLVICGDAGNSSAVGLTVDYITWGHTR